MSAQHTIDLPVTERQPAAGALARTLDDVVALQRRVGALYLRISEGPETDAVVGSWDAESGYPLPGLAVWPLAAEPWWPAGPAVWIARQLVQSSYLLGDRKRPWLLTGTEVGRGADGEPLVTNVTPLADVAPGVSLEAQSAYAAWRCRDFR
ncbi:DUF6098 family protein [Georgenia sp. AZ-5]|uniref:DUF6098 family protein n=1 Tax=Georgenia sp. AZ-5 TaxID=3367526 RepID=UPI003754FA71